MYLLEHDCNELPKKKSPKGMHYGCDSAVWSNGLPAWKYCQNKAVDNSQQLDNPWPWHEACCKWEQEKCFPKNKGRNTFVHYDY